MTPEDQEMHEAMEFAKGLANRICDEVNESGETPADVYFLLWVSLGRILASAGWTEDELIADLKFHVKDQLA